MAKFAQVLSSFDDFPVHQTSRPVAHTSSGNLNHYDRYFFNGVTKDTDLFFALAMGLYPNRHVADAAFSVILGGGGDDAQQINVHASRRAPSDRADANTVGPIQVEVVEPLHTLRLHVDASDQGLRAELTFVRRSAPIEEPPFFLQTGLRAALDYTRLTQFGTWSGWIEVDGQRFDVDHDDTYGCRDRSWGVRDVGERTPSGAPVADPQFFWLWAPLNFEGVSTHFDVNEFADGRRWHQSGFVTTVDGEPEEMAAVDYRLEWEPGTRRLASCEIDLVPRHGEPSTVRLERHFDFHMLGIGYFHPEWSHGVWKGELEVGGDRWSLPVPDPDALHHIHVQSVVTARTTGGLGEHTGLGVLEQLAIGRHVPTGLEGLIDAFSGQG